MHANFFTPVDVPELGDAGSYASRLFDYAGTGSDQLAWVVDRLREDPASRSATITTFEPLTDTTYIPASACSTSGRRQGASTSSSTPTASTSARRPTATSSSWPACRRLVADELDLPAGSLTLYVKSAHVYEPEWALMGRLVESVESPARA